MLLGGSNPRDLKMFQTPNYFNNFDPYILCLHDDWILGWSGEYMELYLNSPICLHGNNRESFTSLLEVCDTHFMDVLIQGNKQA
jgi:hypothetical protein